MLSLFAAATLLCVNAQHYAGSILIREDGQNVTRHVMSGYAPSVQVSGTSITLTHNRYIHNVTILNTHIESSIYTKHKSGVQITQTQTDNYSPDIFIKYKLKGKTVSYTVDISTIGCSCNAALYLVTMPGIGYNGQPSPGNDGSYYCDANDVNSQWYAHVHPSVHRSVVHIFLMMCQVLGIGHNGSK